MVRALIFMKIPPQNAACAAFFKSSDANILCRILTQPPRSANVARGFNEGRAERAGTARPKA
jgi:hypothetical protein